MTYLKEGPARYPASLQCRSVPTTNTLPGTDGSSDTRKFRNVGHSRFKCTKGGGIQEQELFKQGNVSLPTIVGH